MPEILVHAGPDKSGTTAIQRFCRNNRSFLNRFGVEYPCNEDTFSHRWLTAAFLSDKGQLPVTRRCEDSAIRRRTREARQLVAGVAGMPALRRIVLSHEGLHVLSEVELEAYRDFLLENCRPVRVLYYVRDPLDYARSAMSQRVLAGYDPIKPSIPLLDHQAILATYVKVFGREQVEVRRYGNGVLLDFLMQLGINRSIAMRSVRFDYRENVSLSATGLEVGACLVRILSDNDAYPIAFRKLFAAKLRSIPGPRISLTNEQIREIERGSRASIDYLEREFGLRLSGKVEPASGHVTDPSESMRIAQDLFDEYMESAAQDTAGGSMSGSIVEYGPNP